MNKNYTILYIDDNDSYLRFVAGCLSEYNIITRSTKEDGLLFLRSGEHIDLVLVNLNLISDGGDDKLGIDILEIVRDDYPSIPTVVITGSPIFEEGPVVSHFLRRYRVSEVFIKGKRYLDGRQLRDIVRDLLENQVRVTFTQLHNKIPKYIVHQYQRTRLENSKIQLFEIIVEGEVNDNKEIVVVFEQNMYIQKSKHEFPLTERANKYYLSPLFTGNIGDGAEVAISDIRVLIGSKCVWSSSRSYVFQVVDTLPVALKDLASGDSWLLFLIITCITPHSPEITKLVSQILDLWRHNHPEEPWRASRYTPKDVYEIVGYLRDLLKEITTVEGYHIPSLLDDSETIQHAILLPDEIIRRHGANCLYYSLLYASVLESLSIEPLLLFMPGHVLPGWRLSRLSHNNDQMQDLNTMLQDSAFIESIQTPRVDVTMDNMVEEGENTVKYAMELHNQGQSIYLLDVVRLRREGFSPYSNSGRG